MEDNNYLIYEGLRQERDAMRIENTRLLLALREAGGSLSEYATAYSGAAIKHAQKVINSALSPPSASEQSEADLLNDIGLMFLDAMSVKCEPSSYAKAAIARVRRALQKFPPSASEPTPDILSSWRAGEAVRRSLMK